MKFIIEKRNYIIFILIAILCVCLSCIKSNRVFLKSFRFNDKTITIIIYDKVNIKKVSNKIKNIYKKYENFRDLSTLKIDNELENKVDKKDIILSISTNEIINYFKEAKINKYIINANGNITTGQKYSDKKYNISINNSDSSKILKIVSLENESMITIHNDTYNSIAVIGSDLINTNLVAEAIKNLSVDEGESLALQHGCEVLWYYNDEIVLSKNFSKYII